MAELVDALDLGSSVLGRGGSSPPLRTHGVSAEEVAVLFEEFPHRLRGVAGDVFEVVG